MFIRIIFEGSVMNIRRNARPINHLLNVLVLYIIFGESAVCDVTQLQVTTNVALVKDTRIKGLHHELFRSVSEAD